jgi:hypothetical protein
MNIPYLLKILDTNKLSELVANIDLPPIDINLAIWDAVKAGQIEIDEKKDRVTALIKHELTFDSDLASKLLRVMQHYEAKEVNITRGRLNSSIKDPSTSKGYPYHEYLMALHYLIDSGQIEQEVVSVPGTKKRPYHKFVFLQFADNPNEDWNRNEVNKWIANFNKKEVK